MNGYYRAQNEILADVQAHARDSTAARWTAIEVYRSLNRALDAWNGRVSIPMIYTMPSGWSSTDYDYALPAYVRPPVQPQIQYTDNVDYTGVPTWVNLRAWTLEPDGAGGMTLRVRVVAPAPDTTADGRIVWWGKNSRVPTTVVLLNAQINATATSLVTKSVADVEDVGYVKIDSEWIGYAGVTRGTTTTTLSNLQRALNGTTAAIHAADASIYFGVYAPSMAMFQLLNDQILVHLHELFLTDASPRETELHERLMLYYENRVREAWRRFVPARSPVMVQTHDAL